MLSKACPRCHGDLYLERNVDGDEVRCLQCGRALSLAAAGKLIKLAQRRPAPRPAAAVTREVA